MDPDAEIRATVEELSERFPTLPAATVDRLVRRLFAEFQDAPVQTYVPLLVRRAARRTLEGVDHLPAADSEPNVRVRQNA